MSFILSSQSNAFIPISAKELINQSGKITMLTNARMYADACTLPTHLVAVLGQMNRKIKGIFLLKTEKGGKKVVLFISVLPVSKFFSLVWGLLVMFF